MAPLVSVKVDADGWATVRWTVAVEAGVTDVPIAMPLDSVESFLNSLVVWEHGNDPVPAVGVLPEPSPGVLLQLRSESGGDFGFQWRVRTAGWSGQLRWHCRGGRVGWQAWVRLPAIPGLPGGPASWAVEDPSGWVFTGAEAWELTSAGGTLVALDSGSLVVEPVLRWLASTGGGRLVWSVVVERSNLVPDWASGWEPSVVSEGHWTLSELDVPEGWIAFVAPPPAGVQMQCRRDEHSEGRSRVVRSGGDIEVSHTQVRRSTFHLSNQTADRVFAVVPSQAQAGWHRIAPEETDVLPAPFTGFLVDADPGCGAELVVVETGLTVRRVSLLETSPDDLADVFSGVELSESVRSVVEVALARRRRIDELEQRLALRQPQLEVSEDEYRRLMERASTFDPDSAAAKKALSECRQVCQDLDAARAEVGEWRLSADRARNELRAWLESKEA